MANNFKFDLQCRFFVTIAMLYLTVSLACDIVAYKLVSVGNIIFIGAGFIFPLLYVLTDVLTEVFGETNAKIIVWIHVICDFIFTSLIIIIAHLPSPATWHKQSAYDIVLDPMVRLYFAGIVGVLASSLINIHVLSRLKILMRGKLFWFRSICSTSIGLVVYTVVTDLLAFHTAMSQSDLIEITLTNTASNILFAAMYTGFAAYLVTLLKTKLGVDSYEIGSFNPFKF